MWRPNFIFLPTSFILFQSLLLYLGNLLLVLPQQRSPVVLSICYATLQCDVTTEQIKAFLFWYSWRQHEWKLVLQIKQCVATNPLSAQKYNRCERSYIWVRLDLRATQVLRYENSVSALRVIWWNSWIACVFNKSLMKQQNFRFSTSFLSGSEFPSL